MIHLLDDWEAEEFPVFDPSIADEVSWDAGGGINTFLQKKFSYIIRPEEWDYAIKDFQKPSCPALQVDNDMKKQIKKAGKDLYYGPVRLLYNLQKQILVPLPAFGQTWGTGIWRLSPRKLSCWFRGS